MPSIFNGQNRTQRQINKGAFCKRGIDCFSIDFDHTRSGQAHEDFRVIRLTVMTHSAIGFQLTPEHGLKRGRLTGFEIPNVDGAGAAKEIFAENGVRLRGTWGTYLG